MRTKQSLNFASATGIVDKGIRRCIVAGISSAVILLLAAHAAHATPVEWTLNDWGTQNGATVSGSFVYNADSDTFSSILVSDSNGINYNFVGPNADRNKLQFVIDDPSNLNLDDTPFVNGDLEFPGMTNAGGMVPLLINPNATIGICTNADCQIGAPVDNLISGSITGVVVPEPSTAVIMTLGLVWLAARRRP